MADSQTTIRMSINRGNLQRDFRVDRFALDFGGVELDSGAVEVTTTAASVGVSSAFTPGLCFMRNLSDTNAIEIGREEGAVFVPVIRLEPRQPAVFSLAESDVFAKSETGPAVLDFTVFEREVAE